MLEDMGHAGVADFQISDNKPAGMSCWCHGSYCSIIKPS